ncbi:MAG: zinc-ribbon domain-containing protein, partial [Myxococcales bacterium]|nr:zinc-ribbon domain-containing protein [Myxococcales bacterium]
MKFNCEQCGTRYTIADERVRRKVLKIRCKVCESVITVRGDEPAANERSGGANAPEDPLAPVAEVEWYAAPEDEQLGPFPFEQIRHMVTRGEITPDTLVWNEAMPDWRPAIKVEEVATLLLNLNAREQEPTRPLRYEDRIDSSSLVKAAMTYAPEIAPEPSLPPPALAPIGPIGPVAERPAQAALFPRPIHDDRPTLAQPTLAQPTIGGFAMDADGLPAEQPAAAGESGGRFWLWLFVGLLALGAFGIG